MISNILLFIIIYIIVYVIYYFAVIRKYKVKRKKKRKKELKELVEISILKNFYKVDTDKLKYNWLINVCSLVSCLDISILVYFIGFVKNGLIQILLILIFTIPIIFLSFYILSLICKRKLRKDDKK